MACSSPAKFGAVTAWFLAMANAPTSLCSSAFQHPHQAAFGELASRQHRLAVGTDHDGLELRFGQQSLPNLLTIQERHQRRPVENLLGSIRFHRRGAVKFERPASGIEQ